MKTILYALLIFLFYSAGSKEHRTSSKAEDLKRNLVHRIYTAEIGVKEKTGKNDGPRVEEYLRYVRLKKGDPWCASFVCWVLDQAGVANPRTGWSPGLFPKAKVIWERRKVAGRIVAVGREGVESLPQRGDVFGIWFPEKNRIAHAGFVDRWGESWLITVEGNTNEGGSREGDGVLRKRRLVRTVWKVADWVE